MKEVITVCVGAALAIVVGVGCSASSREQAEKAAEKLNEAGEQLAEATEEVGRSLNDSGQGLGEAIQHVQQAVGVAGDIAPIDFRELKAALPGGLEGYTAGKAIGERTKVMGIATSQAEVRLSGDEGSILVRIVDTGSVAGWAALAGRAAGAFAEVDRETEDGFERAGVIDGVRTYESHDGAGGASTIRLFYGDRFSIELNGQNVPWADMEAARGAVDLKRLEALEAESVQTAEAPDEE